MERFLKWLLPHKDIEKNGVLYLRRHYLSPRNWRYRVFLHLINRPDEDRDPHDHPWPFWTLILSGGYIEVIYNTVQQLRGKENPDSCLATTGRLLRRPSTHRHLIAKLIGGRAWTLVIAGPSKRVWGFWNTSGVFEPWDQYLGNRLGYVPDQLPEDEIQDEIC